MPLWVAGSAVVTDPKRVKEAWAASQKVHAYLKGLPDGPDVPEQPMASAAKFNIHLVINGASGPSFDLEPGDKGIFTAAMHYFALDRRPAAAVDFTRTPPPGSASSDLVCELVLQMPPGMKPYEARGEAGLFFAFFLFLCGVVFVVELFLLLSLWVVAYRELNVREPPKLNDGRVRGARALTRLCSLAGVFFVFFLLFC